MLDLGCTHFGCFLFQVYFLRNKFENNPNSDIAFDRAHTVDYAQIYINFKTCPKNYQ